MKKELLRKFMEEAYVNGYRLDQERFAQLIVLECAAIADKPRDTSVGCGYVTRTIGEQIKQHFGIDL